VWKAGEPDSSIFRRSARFNDLFNDKRVSGEYVLTYSRRKRYTPKGEAIG
jgi:hypothetical protein